MIPWISGNLHHRVHRSLPEVREHPRPRPVEKTAGPGRLTTRDAHHQIVGDRGPQRELPGIDHLGGDLAQFAVLCWLAFANNWNP